MYRVAKQFRFEAAHHLENYIGACSRVHGHSYKLVVHLEGKKLNEIGMLMDFKELKHIVDETVIKCFDHEDLNEVLCCNPTAENMCEDIYYCLAAHINHKVSDDIKVHKVVLWETEDSFAEYEEDRD